MNFMFMETSYGRELYFVAQCVEQFEMYFILGFFYVENCMNLSQKNCRLATKLI